MNRLWIDVYEPGSGADAYPESRLGAGPLTNIISWEHAARLDGVGGFSFTVPAADPRASLLTPRRVIWAWTRDADGAPQFAGAGIIDEITCQVGSPTTLRVSGPDLMQELAERNVGNELVVDEAWSYLTGGYGTVRQVSANNENDLFLAYDGDITNTTPAFMIDGEQWWLYVGYDARFDQIRFTLNKVNAHYAGMKWQYYSSTSNGWVDFTPTSDTTMVVDAPFGQSGIVAFTRPLDWARVSAIVGAPDWFYVRVTRHANLGNDIEISLREVEVFADMPTTDGVGIIMGHAPTKWQAPTYPATTSDHYIRFEGESVLAALVILTEHGGKAP